MRDRRRASPKRVRRSGVIALILLLLRAPLPQPDYHSLAHHDHCSGEVCARHDHLLRWHGSPSDRVAQPGEETAVLHWHWVWHGRLPLDDDAEGIPIAHADTEDELFEPAALFVPLPTFEVRTLDEPTLRFSLEWNRDPAAAPAMRPNSFRPLEPPRARRGIHASMLERLNC
jgi:hypothetical protein